MPAIIVKTGQPLGTYKVKVYDDQDPLSWFPELMEDEKVYDMDSNKVDSYAYDDHLYGDQHIVWRHETDSLTNMAKPPPRLPNRKGKQIGPPNEGLPFPNGDDWINTDLNNYIMSRNSSPNISSTTNTELARKIGELNYDPYRGGFLSVVKKTTNKVGDYRVVKSNIDNEFKIQVLKRRWIFFKKWENVYERYLSLDAAQEGFNKLIAQRDNKEYLTVVLDESK